MRLPYEYALFYFHTNYFFSYYNTLSLAYFLYHQENEFAIGKKIKRHFGFKKIKLNWFGPVHDKTYNKTYVTSKDSYQPVHPSNMPKVLVYPSLDSPEAVEGTCHYENTPI